MQRFLLEKILISSFLMMPLWGQDTAPYDCGGLNMRVCTSNDFEFNNIQLGESRQCEVDLKVSDGFCRNDTRNRFLTRNRSWEGWATENQLYSISKDSPINYVTWPASHNAFSNSTQGFSRGLYTNHSLSMTDQLNSGLRHLELDPKIYTQRNTDGTIAGDAVMRLCHAKETWMCAVPGYGNRLFGLGLMEIANWVDANPGQVIYLKLDNRSIPEDLPALDVEVQRYLGHRVYRAPTTFTRWPTIQEIRDSGKSIIVVRHNTDYNLEGSTWIWSAIGLVQSNNHPKNQNFDACTAYDGHSPQTRSIFNAQSWWDVAEGRSLTNTGSADTGLFWESNVKKAAECGVAVVGLDFINALNSSLNLSRREGADGRLRETIWSWSKEDFGRNGPAYLDRTSATWVSFSPTSALPFACALKRPYGNPLQDRGWRVTGGSYPWDPATGNQVCSQEFDTATEKYEFAHPVNGWQNKKLWEAANNRSVWLNYAAPQQPTASYSTSSMVFRMNPGGPLAEPQALRIAARAGSTIEAIANGAAPLSFSLPSAPFTSGEYELAVGIAGTASTLAPGEYNGTLEFTLRAPNAPLPERFSLAIKLVVRHPTALEVLTSATTQAQGQAIDFTLRVTGGLNATGSVKLYRVFDEKGQSVGQQTVAAGDISGATNYSIKPAISNLPLGRHTYIANYNGDSSHLPSESELFAITIVPRIMATPAGLTFNSNATNPPPNQSIALTGLGTSPVVDNPSCSTWLRADLNGSTLVVGLRPAHSSLAVGTYNCTLTVRDALTNQGGGSTDIPVTLHMQTTLSAQPGSVSLYGAQAQSAQVMVTAGGDRNLPLTVSSPQGWLFGELSGAANTTPTEVKIVVDPASLPLGVSNGVLLVSTALAPTLSIPVQFNKVNPTVLNSSPSGLMVTVDGAMYTTPATFVWEPGSVHTIGAVSPQITNGTRHTFSGLSGGSSPFTATSVGGSITANFTVAYLLTTDVVPAASGSIARTPSSPDSYYAPGTTVNLMAAAANGFTFAGYSGSLNSTNAAGSVVLSGPRSVVATFSAVQPIPVSITSMTPGATVTVDGTLHTLPVHLLWTPGNSYRVSTADVMAGAAGVQYVYQSWSTSSLREQNIVAPATPLNLVLSHRRQFYLTAAASPTAGGQLGGGGWYNEGAQAEVRAFPSNGYALASFSGDLTGSTNPSTVTMSAPRNVVANFALTGTPIILLVTGGMRSDGPQADQRIVPLFLSNGGSAPALNFRITGVTGISTLLGSGTVSLASPTPLGLGTVDPGVPLYPNLVFHWPSTARRIRMTINFAYDNGAARSITLTILR